MSQLLSSHGLQQESREDQNDGKQLPLDQSDNIDGEYKSAVFAQLFLRFCFFFFCFYTLSIYISLLSIAHAVEALLYYIYIYQTQPLR